MKLLGNVLGGIILVFRRTEGLKLAEIFSGDAVEASLKEAGSILTASYLASIGSMMKLSLIPSIPKIVDGPLRKTLDDIFNEISQRAEIGFCIETAFIESQINLNGYFLLVPQVNSLDVMLDSLGVIDK
ncbi:MAG: hypothetical protein ABIE84_04970, partial [bacterium]